MANSLPVDVLARLRAAYEPHRDPQRAMAMRAYMRDQFPYLGIGTPARRALDRQVVAQLPTPTTTDQLSDVALACWALAEREYQYFAVDYLRRHVVVATPAFLPTLEHLIVTKPWWDTIDHLAAHVAGPLARDHPIVVSTLDSWLVSSNLWLIRTAILHQLTYKHHTNVERLFTYCDTACDHPDFFIRKAIGWALRQYAHTDPVAVRDYVDSRGPRLSGLTRREALKNILPR